MVRYVSTAAAACLLLGVALLWRSPSLPAADEGAESSLHPDEVRVVDVPGGDREVSVRHHLSGQLSRASLVYEIDGAEKTIDEAAGCQKSLGDGGKIRQGEQGTVVELKGRIPEGACRVNLLLVDETGTRELSVPLQ